MNIQEATSTNFKLHWFIGLLFVAILSLGYASPLMAAGYTIACTDFDDVDTCSIQGSGSLNDDLADLVVDIVEAVANETDLDEICTPSGGEPGAEEYVCQLGESTQELRCVEGNNSYSCTLDGVDEAFLAMSCSADGEGGGQCDVNSDETQIRTQLETIGVDETLLDFASELFAGCGVLGGTTAWRSDCDVLLQALADGDNDEIAATVAAIAPTNASAILDVSVSTLRTQTSHISNRLSRLRNGEESDVDATALRFFDGRQWVTAGELLASNSTTMSDVSPEPANTYQNVGFFLDGSIVVAEQEASTEENSSDSDVQILTAGMDYRFNSNLIGGLAFSLSLSNTEYGEQRGEVDDLGFMLFGYGTYYQDNWYIDGSIGLGGNDYDQERRLVCDASCAITFDQTAESTFRGQQLALILRGGYDWNWKALTVAPYLQFASLSVDIDEYREVMSDPTGPGAGFALDLDDQTLDSQTLSAGTRVSYVLSKPWGVLIPYCDLQVFNEFDDDANLVKGRFVGNVGVDESFELSTTPIDSSFMMFAVGSSVQLKGGSSAFLEFNTLLGNSSLDQYQFSGGWRWAL